MIRITPDEQKTWIEYIYRATGIALDASKAYLLETRLDSLLRETGSRSFNEFYLKVTSEASQKLRREVISAITTHETFFFRDTSPFDLLQHKVIPDLIDKRSKAPGNVRPLPIRIWSAACSTGQEVYSIGIVLKELLVNLSGYDIRILGTDISDQAVAQASYGQYGKLEMERGLAPDKMAKYFTGGGQAWKIHDEIRSMAMFKTMNLFEPFSFPHRFDIIFCRNVAIYFTEADKIRLFKSIARVLAPDGYLIIGATESLMGLCPEFEAKRYLRSVFYQLKEAKDRAFLSIVQA